MLLQEALNILKNEGYNYSLNECLMNEGVIKDFGKAVLNSLRHPFSQQEFIKIFDTKLSKVLGIICLGSTLGLNGYNKISDYLQNTKEIPITNCPDRLQDFVTERGGKCYYDYEKELYNAVYNEDNNILVVTFNDWGEKTKAVEFSKLGKPKYEARFYQDKSDGKPNISSFRRYLNGGNSSNDVTLIEIYYETGELMYVGLEKDNKPYLKGTYYNQYGDKIFDVTFNNNGKVKNCDIIDKIDKYGLPDNEHDPLLYCPDAHK